MLKPLSMIQGRDGDTKNTERRGVPIRTSGRTTCWFVLLWPPKGPNVAPVEKGIAGRPGKEPLYQAQGSKLHRFLTSETAHKRSEA